MSNEPVAWMFQHDETGRINFVVNYGMMAADEFIKVNPCYTLIGSLYNHPPRREWQSLSEEEVFHVENNVPDSVISDRQWTVYFARALDAALRRKNT